MTTETIDKLYLELSHVTSALNARERRWKTALQNISLAPADTDGKLSMEMRRIAREALAPIQ
jgi:hypothetical protein